MKVQCFLKRKKKPMAFGHSVVPPSWGEENPAVFEFYTPQMFTSQHFLWQRGVAGRILAA